MLRRDGLEDVDNHERWLISYADFITLLFGFFVVMYAISSVNEGKYRVLSSTLTATFSKAPTSLDPIQVGDPLLAASPYVIDIPGEQGFRDEEEGDSDAPFAAEEASERLGVLAAMEGAEVRGDSDWLEISLDGSVLFAPGAARLTAAARSALAGTASYLGEFDNPITVEGHSDNVLPTGGPYASNWALSAARAAAVADFLVSQGIRRQRLAAVGYGDSFPVATNATPGGRAANRRVVIAVSRQLGRARGLNAAGSFAAVRRPDTPALDPDVQQRRTPQGGLLFTNEPAPDATDANP